MTARDELNSFSPRINRESSWSRGEGAMPKAPAQGGVIWLYSFVINILGLGLPIVLLQVYDRILPYQATETMTLLVLGLITVLLIDALLRAFRSAVTGWNAARFEHRTACRAVDRLLSLTVREFERDPAGVHLDRLAAINTLRDYHAGQAKLLFLDFPFILVFLSLIYFIAGPVVLVPLTIFAVFGLLAIIVGFRLRAALAERAVLDDRRYSFIIEALSGIHSIKLLAMEPQMQRRYERLQESAAGATYEVTLIGNIAQGIGWLASNLTMVMVAGLGSLVVMEGGLSIGGLAASTLLAGRAVQPVLRGLGLWSQYQSISIAEQRLEKLFESSPEAPAAPGITDEIQGAIEIDGLGFAYGPEDPVLMENLSVEIAAGELIGVKGESGAGKSTFLMLLMGLLRPTSGKIRIDGNSVEDFDPYALRQQIAFLPQTATLFQGTIMDNLTIFESGPVVKRALEAARLIGVDEAIRHLPEGYQTEVGSGAAMELPVGLKQGIAMARAIARDPKIILFDEANGGLDSAADEALREALLSLKGKCTIIIVSHRPSLLNIAERRFRLLERRLLPEEDCRPAAAVSTARIEVFPDDEASDAPSGDKPREAVR